MAGAIVPDDWDGSTYNCYRVNWPQSLQYEAILLGSVSEPAWLNFWDPETGDEQEAADAIETAYRVTVADMWTKECDEPVLVPAFKVYQTEAQAFSASAWQVVEWDAYFYNPNSPQFQLATNVHQLTNDDWLGLWHYDLLLAVTAGSALAIRALDFATLDVKVRTYEVDRFITLSWDWEWKEYGMPLGIHVWPYAVCNTFPQIRFTQFSGHYVGPTA